MFIFQKVFLKTLKINKLKINIFFKYFRYIKGRSLVPQLGHVQAWSCATPGMLSMIG